MGFRSPSSMLNPAWTSSSRLLIEASPAAALSPTARATTNSMPSRIFGLLPDHELEEPDLGKKCSSYFASGSSLPIEPSPHVEPGLKIQEFQDGLMEDWA